ncbi:MAG: hypothetical protein ACTHU0_03565, partial [Kofleriaceae bacterium]
NPGAGGHPSPARAELAAAATLLAIDRPLARTSELPAPKLREPPRAEPSPKRSSMGIVAAAITLGIAGVVAFAVLARGGASPDEDTNGDGAAPAAAGDRGRQRAPADGGPEQPLPAHAKPVSSAPSSAAPQTPDAADTPPHPAAPDASGPNSPSGPHGSGKPAHRPDGTGTRASTVRRTLPRGTAPRSGGLTTEKGSPIEPDLGEPSNRERPRKVDGAPDLERD